MATAAAVPNGHPSVAQNAGSDIPTKQNPVLYQTKPDVAPINLAAGGGRTTGKPILG